MKTDFEKWLDYHCGAYPNFLKWLSDKENSRQVSHMRRLLEPFTIESLCAATDRLYACDDQPRGYGEHARVIKRFIGEAGYGDREEKHEGPLVKDGSLVADCPRCMDYGIVEVISPAGLRSLLRYDGSTNWLRTCVVACSCRRGSAKARHLKLPQWTDGVCLLRYETIMDRAIKDRRDAASLQDAMWEIAHEMLTEFDSRPRQMAMVGDEFT